MYFGEEAILRKCKRTASIVAITSAETLHLSRESFMRIVQHTGSSVIKAIREKVRKNHNIRPISLVYKEFLEKTKREKEIKKELLSESKYSSLTGNGGSGAAKSKGQRKMNSSASAPGDLTAQRKGKPILVADQ